MHPILPHRCDRHRTAIVPLGGRHAFRAILILLAVGLQANLTGADERAFGTPDPARNPDWAAGGENTYPVATADHRASVLPDGWRRTVDGWEHTSEWAPAPRPLGELIRHQRDREPEWLQATLAQVRGIPPLQFAFLQLASILVIVRCSQRNRRHGGGDSVSS